jgi:hypothetical protein
MGRSEVLDWLTLARIFPTDTQSVLLSDAKRPQSDLPRLAGGTIPFIRRYSTICP